MVGMLDDQDDYSLCCLVELGVVDPTMANWIKKHDEGHEMIEAINDHVVPITTTPVSNELTINAFGSTRGVIGVVPDLSEQYRTERRKKYGAKYRAGESLAALDGAKEVLTTMAGSAAQVLGQARAAAIHKETQAETGIARSLSFAPDMVVETDEMLFDPGIIQQALDHNFVNHFLHGIGQQVERLNEDIEDYSKAGYKDDPRPHYYHKLQEENARYNLSVNAFTYAPMSRRYLKTDKRIVKSTRKVLRRSYELACRVLGHSSVEFYVGGKEIVVAGVLYDFAFSKSNYSRSLVENGHGNINIYVRKRGSTKNLVSMCVYFQDTPVLDQLVGMTLLIRSGEEDTILKTANFSRIARDDDPDLLELYEFAGKEMYYRGNFTITDCRVGMITTNTPPAFAKLFAVDQDREKTISEYTELVAPVVRAYVTDKLLELISPVTRMFMEHLDIPLPVPETPRRLTFTEEL